MLPRVLEKKKKCYSTAQEPLSIPGMRILLSKGKGSSGQINLWIKGSFGIKRGMPMAYISDKRKALGICGSMATDL